MMVSARYPSAAHDPQPDCGSRVIGVRQPRRQGQPSQLSSSQRAADHALWRGRGGGTFFSGTSDHPSDRDSHPIKLTRQQIREPARPYLKVVEWSTEDNAFVGSAPPIIGHCCHGETEAAVVRKLTPIVEARVEVFRRDGRPLPEPSAGKTCSGKFLVRVPPDVHRKAALKAKARGESLNQFVAEAIANA